MNITVIGSGYVGLVAGACFADMGHSVICVDNDHEKLDLLRRGVVPIYEPQLEGLIINNVREGRLTFTNNLAESVKASQICFIAVGTPQGDDGSADMKYVKAVAKDIALAMDKYTVVVNKSTVPVGTGDVVRNIISKHTDCEFDVVSNPEFLKQGEAVNDFLHPDRVVIGADNERAAALLNELYSKFDCAENCILNMDVKSAELAKYAANSFLATKISFMNEISNLCEVLDADVEMVRKGMSLDIRIGSRFLNAGIGYGGSCFPKDVKALIKSGDDCGCEMSIIKRVDQVNKNQKERFVNRLKERFGENLKGMHFGVWGLAFKPETNDMRESPSIYIIKSLLEEGCTISAYDPKATSEAQRIFGDRIKYTQSSYEATNEADCLLLLTEWREFKSPNFAEMGANMRCKIVFDGRNQYERSEIEKFGFEYHRIGSIK
ncbi:MAG: UDP-glucose/GDP-mannose dehydrogenase family protein [Rikenellaceae bacterium]